MNGSLRKAVLLIAGSLLFGAAADAAAQTRIRFAKGRTSASISSRLPPVRNRTYVLRASEGQWLSANINSEKKCVTFQSGENAASFSTVKGDNKLVLTNTCKRSGTFILTVSIGYSGR